jgi:hypothetical protein
MRAAGLGLDLRFEGAIRTFMVGLGTEFTKMHPDGIFEHKLEFCQPL